MPKRVDPREGRMPKSHAYMTSREHQKAMIKMLRKKETKWTKGR